MKEFLASLISESWLIEETWLRTMIDGMGTESANSLPSALDTLPSEGHVGTQRAKIYGSVASLPVYGPIFPKPNFMTRYLGIGTSLEDLIKDAKVLDKDSSISTIIFDIDSPGGLTTGVNEASFIIKNLSTKTIAYVGGTGASAAYWLATAADKRVLEATARVGSIGVVVALPNPQEEKRWSIEVVNSKSPNKRIDVSTKEGKKSLVSHLDDIADVFISTVAKNLGVSEDTVVNDFGKGGMLVGQKAVDAGMADSLGFFEDLISSNTESNEIYSIKTKGESLMDLTKLKAEHKDLYDSIVASTAKATADALEASTSATIAEKDTEIATLTATLEEQKTANSGMEDRLKSLEKNDLIRSEERLKERADAIMLGKLKASDLPDRLHSKIKGLVDYNKFVSEGKLDETAYSAKIDEEVKDFSSLAPATTFSIEGVSTVSNDPDDGSDDASVDACLKVLGVSEEGK